MQEILEDKFSSLTELLNKYESIGINVEEARKTLNSLNQEYYSKTKEELSSELNCFTNSLKTLDKLIIGILCSTFLTFLKAN